MKKLSIVSILLLVLLAVFLTACGSPEPVIQEVEVTREVEVVKEVEVEVAQTVEVEVEVTREVEVEADTPTPPPPSDPVAITFWYAVGGSRGEVLQAMIDEFNATNPYGITVDATYTGGYGDTANKVLASLESGGLPDGGLVPAAPLWTCREENYLIEDYMAGPEGIDKDDYWPVLWDYNTYDGRVCSLPFNNSTMVMYYNKDLMTSAGLDPEAPPQTWDELSAQAKAIVDANPGMIGVDVRGTDWWLKSLILQNGGQIMNEDSSAPAFASEEGYGAMEYWQKLINDGLMPAAQHGDSRDLFLAGQMGFFMSSTGNIGRVQNGAQFEWGTDFLPGGADRGATVGGAALAMFPNDEAHELATWRFLKWLVEPENSARFAAKTGYVPISKSALDSAEIKLLFANEPEYIAGFKQLGIASQYAHFWEMGTMDDYLGDAIEQMEIGGVSPKDALDEASNKLIDEMSN